MHPRITFFSESLKNSMAVCITTLFLLVLVISPSLYAQTEQDTTRTTREGPEEIEQILPHTPLTPYRITIPGFNIDQYELNDYEGTHTFFKRLEYQNPGEILMAEKDWYERYGPEWERELNENLNALLAMTFKEQNSFLRMLSRIAPFLGFGFFEEYEVPIVPRIDDADRVYIED